MLVKRQVDLDNLILIMVSERVRVNASLDGYKSGCRPRTLGLHLLVAQEQKSLENNLPNNSATLYFCVVEQMDHKGTVFQIRKHTPTYNRRSLNHRVIQLTSDCWEY